MKFQNKIFLCILVSFLILISSGVAFADEAPAMELVENGTVSGDAQIVASNPWGKTSGSLEYTIPDNVEEIKSVNVVVSSYSGSGAPTYALYSNITLNTKNGLEILAYDDLFCDISMTNDPTVYVINNHTTKQYSDYQSFFNITDSVKDLSPGDTIKISVENSLKEGYGFDGRIKLIALTFAYDDGDDDEINYWLNVGQSWTQATRSNLIKTKDFDGEYDEVTFEDIALSSYNAICRINGKIIYDPIYEKTGGYFIDDIWNITDNFIVGQDTNFTYKASSSGYGSFKSNIQLLKTTKAFRDTPVLYINADKNIFVGENLTIDVSLPADATGNVSIGDTVNSLENGNASFVISDLAEGTYTFTVKYSGDEKYKPISNKTTVNVEDVHKVTPVLKIEADDIFVGENLTINVILPGNATGEVSTDDIVASLKDGNATFVISDLALGTYTFTVKYSGDDNYNSVSNETTVNVNAVPRVTPVLYIDADDIFVGENLTIDVSLPDDATGDVNIESKIITLKDGKATFVIPDLEAGTHTFTVKYSGDEKYAHTNNMTTVSVNEKKSLIISAPDVTKYYKGSERLVVTVTDNEGNPLSNKSVNININNMDYTRITDANGTASMALGLPSNVYNASIMVDNETANSVVNILPTVNGTDVVKMYRNGTQYYATFRDSQGRYLANETTVNFNINGVMYERKVSGDKGLARLNLNLPQGEYIITAINPENGEMASNNITVLSKLVENRNITKYFKNETQYTVKVLGDNGKPVGAGVYVKFNINGVFYTRRTNESGIAELTINLVPGDYQITAEYSGCKVANTVKVLPILTASDVKMKYRDGTKFVAKLVDGQGKPDEGQTVDFNINGVLYKRTTGYNGRVYLNINLIPGEYIITSSFYNGATIANKITISN
jgi:hypothetical protein